jgi:hypothetical protein
MRLLLPVLVYIVVVNIGRMNVSDEGSCSVLKSKPDLSGTFTSVMSEQGYR